MPLSIHTVLGLGADVVRVSERGERRDIRKSKESAERAERYGRGTISGKEQTGKRTGKSAAECLFRR
jgi:hypothetical protein